MKATLFEGVTLRHAMYDILKVAIAALNCEWETRHVTFAIRELSADRYSTLFDIVALPMDELSDTLIRHLRFQVRDKYVEQVMPDAFRGI